MSPGPGHLSAALVWCCAHRREQAVWQAPQPAVLVGRSAHAVVAVHFADGSAPVEITGACADLVLDGLRLAGEQADLERLEIAVREVAEVRVDDDAQLVALVADAGSGEVSAVDRAQVLYLLSLAVAAQITAGVAHEAVEGDPTGGGAAGGDPAGGGAAGDVTAGE